MSSVETSFADTNDYSSTPLLSGIRRSSDKHTRGHAADFGACIKDEVETGDTKTPLADAVFVEAKVLVHKSIHQEKQAINDLKTLGDVNGPWPIVLDLELTEPFTITAELLLAITKEHERAQGDDSLRRSSTYADRSELAMVNALISQHRLFRDRRGVINNIVRTWGSTIQGTGYLIATASSSAVVLGRCCVAIGRLRQAVDLGALLDTASKFVIIIIGPENIEETKSPLEVGRTIAALFSDAQFYGAAVRAKSPDEVKAAVLEYVAQHEAAQSERSARVSRPSGNMYVGLLEDLRRRKACYSADFSDVLWDSKSRMKLCSATMFIFCSNVANAVAFGAVNSKNTTPTGGTVGFFGVREMLLSQALGGIMWAFVAGQPLVVIQTTGPLAVFFKVLFTWSETLKTEFLPFYSWVGLWLCAMLAIISVTGASWRMNYVTLYTMEIFALLVAGIFLSEAITWIINDYVDTANEPDRSAFLLNFVLWALVFLIGNQMTAARRSILFNGTVRTILSDFGPIIAICIASAVAYLPNGIADIPIDKLTLPDSPPWEPSIPRPWLVDLGDIAYVSTLLAVFPAGLLCILFYLDHNTTGRLVNRPENKLTKGTAYNLDFMSLAVVNLVLSLLGLPWVHGALPFSPMHAQALADATETQRHGAIARTVVIARETRLSNLIAHVLILLLVGARPLLEAIPTAVLYGFFLFVGVSALGDNSMWTRMELFVVEPTKYPSNHYMRFVPMKDLHLFTAVQLAVFAVLWMVKAGFYVETSFPISLLFPFVLALVVPFRIHVLPKLFKDGDIRAILAGEEAEQSVFA